MHYRVQRAGEVDLEFDGELIADESTQGETRGSHRADPTRWTEIRIYRIDSEREKAAKWLVEYVGKSSRPGETDRPRIRLCRTPEQVKEALRRRPGEYLINAAIDALSEAAEKDERLSEATVERL